MQKAVLNYLIKHPLENIVATKIIKDSLMKHIPMEIIEEGPNCTDAFRCPACNGYVGNQEDGLCCNYCPMCGQRVVQYKTEEGDN